MSIAISFDEEKVTVRDTAGGIPAEIAEHHVFKFGRTEGGVTRDRLSVYGIGLKRAIFKIGQQIDIKSDHIDGGFNLDLDVARWAADASQPWTFPITKRDPASAETCGTTIIISKLTEDVKRRLNDGVFRGHLKNAIARTYAFYMAKFVTILIDGEEVDPVPLDVGRNRAAEAIQVNGVSCYITAGIGVSQGGQFRDSSSGWFVFCNGRVVISADKSSLTGWSNPGAGLPIFQPKHRPFIGTVFFVSDDPERLPWTTTKSGINEDSAVWQTAKRHMVSIGRGVVSFLDGRYTDEGTEVATADLREVAQERVSVLSSSVDEKLAFNPPKIVKPKNVKIQYYAQIADVAKIESYLRRPSMSAAEIGRYTFLYYLRNEVGDK